MNEVVALIFAKEWQTAGRNEVQIHNTDAQRLICNSLVNRNILAVLKCFNRQNLMTAHQYLGAPVCRGMLIKSRNPSI